MDEVEKRWKSIRRRSDGRHELFCDLNEFRQWYSAETKVCCYCGIEEEFLRLYCTRIASTRSLHVDRVNNNSGYVLGNMRFACYNCNSIIKRTRTKAFVAVVVNAILDNGMLDEYHLWNVPLDLRMEACLWDQFVKVESLRRGNEIGTRFTMPNASHYVPDLVERVASGLGFQPGDPSQEQS